MCEQSGPKQLAADARRAEAAGFPCDTQGAFVDWAARELLPVLASL